MGRLAMWRLQTHEQFGGTWLSDYVPNRLGGFLSAQQERQKPDCELIGEYIKCADPENEADIQKLNHLAAKIDGMSQQEQYIFSGALDAESVGYPKAGKRFVVAEGLENPLRLTAVWESIHMFSCNFKHMAVKSINMFPMSSFEKARIGENRICYLSSGGLVQMRYKYRKAGMLLLGAALGTIYLAAPGRFSKELAAPFYGRNIAHRGLHSGDSQVPENSLSAFWAATEAGYGVELDLQMTKDGQVVVYHDDDLKRVCGVEGRIEDMSFPQLRRLTLFGSKEHIPLFSEVLDIVDGRVPMIVELKRSEQNRELCEATLELLRAYDGNYCVESFDPEIVAWFRYNAPDILRGQLSNVPHELRNHTSRIKAYLVGHLLTNFMTRPHFVAYGLEKKPLTVRLCEKMGAMKVCWTSLEPKNEAGNDVVIFQQYHPVVKFK